MTNKMVNQYWFKPKSPQRLVSAGKRLLPFGFAGQIWRLSNTVNSFSARDLYIFIFHAREAEICRCNFHI